MKLIYIYGPPAAGKLTVSQSLAEKTGFEIVHNHTTFDIFRQVVKERDQDFWKRVEALRLELIMLAAKNDINIICTLCYEHNPSDIKYIKKVKISVKEFGGEVCFVHLTPSKYELLSRVLGESRKNYLKLKDPSVLDKALSEEDYYTTIEDSNSLVIDNTAISADEVSEIIIKRFKL